MSLLVLSDNFSNFSNRFTMKLCSLIIFLFNRIFEVIADVKWRASSVWCETWKGWKLEYANFVIPFLSLRTGSTISLWVFRVSQMSFFVVKEEKGKTYGYSWDLKTKACFLGATRRAGFGVAERFFGPTALTRPLRGLRTFFICFLVRCPTERAVEAIDPSPWDGDELVVVSPPSIPETTWSWATEKKRRETTISESIDETRRR